jgi:hypothetical protein
MMLRALCLASIGVMLVAHAALASPYADTVISYDPGTGASAGYDDPGTALGAPSRTTGGPSDVTIFNSPWETTDVVSIGAGGHLTVFFDEPIVDDPLNPYGTDLLIFGNSFFFAGPGFTVDGVSADPASVYLSDNGTDFVEVPGVFADDLFPTQGFLDTTDPFGGFGGLNDGTIPSNFFLPVDPALSFSDLLGLSYLEVLALYAGSGGGTSVDLASVGLSSAQYVRIEGLAASAEIDAFVNLAAAPEPGALALLLLGLPIIARRRRNEIRP